MRLWLTALLCLAATTARAELYVAGDLMQSRFAGPSVDGTWRQDMLPSVNGVPAVKQTKEDLAWGAGLGYRFDAWTVEAGYRNWGTVKAGGLAVSDEAYAQVLAHGAGWLREHCVTPAPYTATDSLEGGYVKATRGLQLGDFEPYVAVGAFAAQHSLGINGRAVYAGIVAGPLVGGGLRYEIYRGIKARVSVDSHWTVTENKHPISSQWLTVGGGLEVPLW